MITQLSVAGREAPAGPDRLTPARHPGSVRRTSHLDVGPTDRRTGWNVEGPVALTVRGACRDLVTSERDAETIGEATLTARVDGQRRLVRLTTTPEIDAVPLLGTRIGPGFRGPALSQVEDPRSPLGLLLRDLPTAVLVSGYAHLRTRTLAGAPPGDLVPPEVLPGMEDLCSGWRSDGTMARSIAAGDGVPVQRCPDAPPVSAGDELAWHHVPGLPAGWMRRRRRLDVARVGDELVVDAMFRDSYRPDPDPGTASAAAEGVLHEYGLAAWIGVEDHRLNEITATARVVPYDECPRAADNLERLVGHRIDELRGLTRDELAGTAGCTHLNDLVACLADLPDLLDA